MADHDDEHRPRFVAIDGDRKPKGANDDAADPTADIEGANDDAIRLKINRLKEEHRDLDTAIGNLEERMPYDRLTIQRLKKRKLILRDEIQELHELILPDIIA